MTSFGFLFMMEVGDKTQLAVLGLTAASRQSMAIFVGSTLALTTITLMGVGVGVVLGESIPTSWLSRVTGIAFIGIGSFLLWYSRLGTATFDGTGEDIRMPSRGRGFLGMLSASFLILFAAEMGDKSQLAVISIVAKSDSPLSVFVGASLALALLTLLTVLVGKAVTRIVSVHWVSRGTALFFISLGFLILAGVY